MPPPDFHSFHLRMPKRLKDELQAAVGKGGKSLNAEIVQRLERTLGPNDTVLRLAETLAPVIDGLSDEDREALMKAARVLAKNMRKARK